MNYFSNPNRERWIVWEIELREEDGKLGQEDEKDAFADALRALWPSLPSDFREAFWDAWEPFQDSDYHDSRERRRYAESRAALNRSAEKKPDDSDKTVPVPWKRSEWNAALLRAHVSSCETLAARVRDSIDAVEKLHACVDAGLNGVDVSSFDAIDDIVFSTTKMAELRGLERQREEELLAEKADCAKKLEKISEELEFSYQWAGAWHMGSGSFGEAHLWIRQSSAGVVSDRVIVKDSYLDEGLWDDKQNWHRLPGKKGKVPMEVITMLRLRTRLGAPETIVRLRNWRIKTSQQLQRLYMEFCPFRDLWDVIMDSTKGTYNANRRYEGKGEQFVPEPFIWFVFEQLVNAGLLMEKGELDAQRSEWESIVHRDIKLGNVFLGTHLEGKYKGYPAPKLGDWGLAVIIAEGDRRLKNPREFEPMGTLYTRAPEQRRPEFAALSEKTNVFAVGNLIWGLVMVLEGDIKLEWDKDDDRPPGEEPIDNSDIRQAAWDRRIESQFDDVARAHYSRELLTLASECMRFQPDDRPTFWELRRRIRQYTITDAKATQRTGGLRDANRADSGFALLGLLDESWVIGSLAQEWDNVPDPNPDTTLDGDDDEPGGKRGAEVTQTAQEAAEAEAVAKGWRADDENRNPASTTPPADDFEEEDLYNVTPKASRRTVPKKTKRKMKIHGPKGPRPPTPEQEAMNQEEIEEENQPEEDVDEEDDSDEDPPPPSPPRLKKKPGRPKKAVAPKPAPPPKKPAAPKKAPAPKKPAGAGTKKKPGGAGKRGKGPAPAPPPAAPPAATREERAQRRAQVKEEQDAGAAVGGQGGKRKAGAAAGGGGKRKKG